MDDAIETYSKFRKLLARLTSPGHACLIYNTQAEQVAVAVSFISIGLERGERCVYIAPAELLTSSRLALEQAGLNVATAIASGSLHLVGPRERHLSSDPNGLDALVAAIATLQADQAGVRVLVEMSWLPDGPALPDPLQFEARLDELATRHKFLTLCQYNRHGFAPEVLLRAIRTHAWIIATDTLCQNTAYISPAEFLLPSTAEKEVDWILAHLRESEATLIDHRVVPTNDAAGNLLLIEGIALDITATQLSEQRERLAYELGRSLITLLEPNALLTETVNRLSETFGYYHAHVYLFYPARGGEDGRAPDKQTGELIVQAGTGPAGAEMKRRRHTIPLQASQSLVARAGRSLEPVVGNHVRSRPDYLPNPLLPNTQAEAAIPLFTGNRLIGVLDVQHTAPDHFGLSEIRTLQIVASQLSVALVNAQLFTENARRSAIIENSSDLIALVNPANGRLIDINPAGARLAGYDNPKKMIGLSLADLHRPEDMEWIEQEGLPIALTDGIWREENRLFRADGSLVPVEQTILAIRDELGRPHTLAVLMSDITERKGAEEALRQSQLMYQELADSIADVFIALDKDLRYTYWNKASEKLTGIPADKAIGMSVFDLFPNNSQRDGLAVRYRQSMETQQPQRFVYQAQLGPTARFLEVNTYPSRHGLSVVAHDITERIQAEQALQQRNRALDLLNRAGRVFISTHNLDQVLAVILEEIRHVLDVIACSAWLIDPATGELVCRQVTDPQSQIVRGWRLKPGQGLAGWVVQHGESLVIPDTRTDRRHFRGVDDLTGLDLHSILTVPLRARQNIIGVLQVVDTVVDRFNEADLALLESLAATASIAIENARLYEQARQDAETKSTLLAEVNHRVKNNLAAVVGLLYAEKRHAGLENQVIYQVILNDLISRVQGLATVHSLLSASEWAPVALSDVARQVTQSSLQVLPRNRQVSINVPARPVKVTSDQAHNLALIINELVTNTIQHAIIGRTAATITINVSQQNDLIQCEFRDDGPGYPEAMLQPNQRGNNLGFELIQNLVLKSLRGELILRNDGGAVTIIRFKSKLKDEAQEEG